MKRIFIPVLILVLSLPLISAQDETEKEKETISFIINKLVGEIFDAQQNDDEIDVFNKRFQNILQGVEENKEPVILKKSFDMDKNKDGKRKGKIDFDIKVSPKHENSVDIEMNMSCNTTKYDLTDDEKNYNISLEGDIYLNTKGAFNTEKVKWENFVSEIKGKLDYSGTSKGRAEIYLRQDEKGIETDPDVFIGKIKINNKESDYKFNLNLNY